MKRVTILMPVYNASKFLYDSIKSILNSTYSDFELLVVDDGSTDNSKDIVLKFNDSRIRLIENDHNYIESLNVGLRLSEGEYIARMDADDIMEPNRLKLQVELLDSKKEIDICSTWMIGLKENGGYKPLFTRAGEINILELVDENSANPIFHPTVMMRKSTLQKYSLNYKSEYNVSEDLKLWVDLGKLGGKFYIIPKFLHLYRQHSEQVSRAQRKLQKEQTNQILKELRDENRDN